MLAEVAVKTTGRVCPMRAAGGSKVTESGVVEATAQVALLDVMVSARLLRYDARLITVFTPAGTVTAVTRGPLEAVEVAWAVEVAGTVEEEEPPITVTKTSTV